jgi:hypothetical protein
MNPQRLQQLAEQVATEACESRQPKMAAAALIRHRFKHLTKEEIAELRDAAYQLIREKKAAESKARAPGAEWVTIDEAALLLGVTTQWLRRALIWPQFRQTLGWPRCLNGQQMWRFPRAALMSGTSHAFAATLPEREPLHALPTDHRRQDDVDMGVWPPELGSPPA